MSNDKTKITKITFVLYEGKHDAAILTRLLRLNGFSEFKDKKLKDFPPKLKGYFERKIANFTYEDETNIFQKPQMPNHVCKSDQNQWFVFYAMGGDSQLTYVKAIISELKTAHTDFDPEVSFETEHPVSLLFFFDADKNITSRKRSFTKEYATLLPNFAAAIEASTSHKISTQLKDGFNNLGLYIYGGPENSGTLEDLIIPIMREGKEDLFRDAEALLEKYMPSDSNTSGSKKGKALIGVVGQPKHPGKANQVIISDTKMLTKQKLSDHKVFNEILSLLLKF